MSRWTHAICPACFDQQRGRTTQRTALLHPVAETCCWCGEPTESGLYLRANPAEVRCQGGGAFHRDD